MLRIDRMLKERRRNTDGAVNLTGRALAQPT